MTILHINSAFCITRLHIQLVQYLDALGIKQIVYVPLKTYKTCVNEIEIQNLLLKTKNVSVITSKVVRLDMRIRYFLKIKTILKDLESSINLDKVDLIHSHFLYSDGGVAYLIKQKYRVPFITAIRNTDVNVFFKYFLHCRAFCAKTLSEANQIIFISPSYKTFLEKNYFKKFKNNLLKKTLFIPNGIDDYFLKNKAGSANKISDKIKFIFIGELSKNKNIHGAISLLKTFRDKYNVNALFDIVGPKGDYSKQLSAIIEKLKWVNYIGPIYDKSELKNSINNSDIFIMISKKETFGLVYAEAMSQGLPVVFSKGQGIDGIFDEKKIGASINFKNPNTDLDKIKYIINNYSKISDNVTACCQLFDWAGIAKQYYKCYESNLKGNSKKT